MSDEAEKNSLAPLGEVEREKRYCEEMDSSSFQRTFTQAKLETVNGIKKCGQKVCGNGSSLSFSVLSRR